MVNNRRRAPAAPAYKGSTLRNPLRSMRSVRSRQDDPLLVILLRRLHHPLHIALLRALLRRVCKPL